MKKTCADCGEHEALPEDELCKECRDEMDGLNKLSIVYKIPWKKYDPKNPPEGSKDYLVVTLNKNILLSYLETSGRWWWNNEYLYGITHYAEINLPE